MVGQKYFLLMPEWDTSMTVKQHCEYLGWSINELSRRANIDYRSAHKAYSGDDVSGKVKQKIAKAISDATGQTIQPGEISWS